MSPRAAWRLESLGFERVFDYVAGKVDWFAAGLPRAGEQANSIRAGDVARHDVPTCSLAEQIGKVRERVRSAGWDSCVVVNEQHVVLGLLAKEALEADPAATAEQVMESGPTTFRPNEPLEEIAHFMHEHELKRVRITTSDGRLVGLLRWQDLEAALAKRSTS